MPPKRPSSTADRRSMKRIKSGSTQTSIQAFFGVSQGPSMKTNAGPPLRPEIIMIDDDSDETHDANGDNEGRKEMSETMTVENGRIEATAYRDNNANVDRILGPSSIPSNYRDVLPEPGPSFSSYDTFKRPGIPRIASQGEHPSNAEFSSVGSGASLTPATVVEFPDLTVDPLLFDPRPNVNHSPWWSKGSSAPYALLVHALYALTSTRSRITILSTLTNVLRILIAHDPDSILSALYLLSNTLGPPWEGIELGVGGSAISKALQTTMSITPATMRELYRKYGDPGDVAYHAVVGTTSGPRTSVLKPHPPLLIKGLYHDLRKIACAKGEGRQKIRQAITDRLVLSAVGSSWRAANKSDKKVNLHLLGEEPRYLIRTLVQNLRVGAVRTTLLNALARAVALTPPSHFVAIEDDEYGVSILPVDLEYVRSSLRAQSASPSPRKGKAPAKVGSDEGFRLVHTRVQNTLKRAEEHVKRAFAQHPSFDDLVTALLQRGIRGMVSPVPPLGLSMGVPLMPTLGSPMRSLDDVYQRLGPNASWTAEMKYDGQRAQVHAWRVGEDVKVKIFSRHLEDMTDKYPDLVHLIVRIFQTDPSIDSFIVDAEAVAIDPQTGDLRSFQELSGRARKDVKVSEVKVAVCLFLFDLMLFNGISLLQRPFRERRQALRARLPPFRQHSLEDGNGSTAQLVRASLDQVESVESDQGREAVEEFWEKAVESKCEGLMIKLLDDVEIVVENEDDGMADDNTQGFRLTSIKGKKGLGKGRQRTALPATYEPDKRTSAWLKLKKDYVEGVGDSLDLVPVGAWHGNGRKAQWWSPILLATHDKERGMFVALCKCMSGFTDAFYKALNQRYSIDSDSCSHTPRWNVETGGYRPTVYFKPMEVWEIRGADLTISPTSVTALGMLPIQDKGLSLRFPRFIRIRGDKSVEMASTPNFVVQLWRSKESKGAKSTEGGVDDGDLVDLVEEDQYESSDGSIEV